MMYHVTMLTIEDRTCLLIFLQLLILNSFDLRYYDEITQHNIQL